MNILLVCPYDFSRPGGVKSHIISLSNQLTIIGHKVKIVAPNININLVKEKNICFFSRNKSVNIWGTKIDVNIALGKEKRALKDFLRTEKFDIIHYHTIWNPFLPFQIRKYSRAKQIATFHDTPKNKFVGKWIMPIMARIVFIFLDQIISVSKSQEAFISSFSKRKIHIIPNGIDLHEGDKPFFGKKHRVDTFFQLFFLGRLEPRKGVMHALKAFHHLKKKYSFIRLIIAGDGDGRAEVEQYIATHSLNQVDLIGFVNDKTKYHLLKESDIYLAPALYGESFGIVLLEAMAVGTPIAGYANAGYKNVITKEMEEGFATPGDLDEFIACIENLIPLSKREILAKHGIEEVKKYDWVRIAKKINDVYLEPCPKIGLH